MRCEGAGRELRLGRAAGTPAPRSVLGALTAISPRRWLVDLHSEGQLARRSADERQRATSPLPYPAQLTFARA